MKVLLCSLLVLLFSVFAQAKEIKLTTRNSCYIQGPITRSSTLEAKYCLVKQVAKRGIRRYPIYLSLNSPGGSVVHGLDFIEFAKTIRNLHTINVRSASMAAAIIQHLPGTRYYRPNSIMMFHRAKTSISGQIESGELESRLALIKRIIRKSEMVQAKRMFMTLKAYKKKILNEWWLHGNEQRKHNAADEPVTILCSIQLINTKVEKSVRTIFGIIKTEKSECPAVN
jgi:ATP-dependent protease ClpP protease subunit